MRSDIAIVSVDPVGAVIAATWLRREGLSVYTQFSGGKLARQIVRARRHARTVYAAEGGGLREIRRGSLEAVRKVFNAGD